MKFSRDQLVELPSEQAITAAGDNGINWDAGVTGHARESAVRPALHALPERIALRRLSRRELLCIGGLSYLGLSSAELSRLRAAMPIGSATAEQQRRRNACVFLILFGGPSQIKLWHMRPEAPVEIRGEFRPVPTAMPGNHGCEHLPRLARQMDKVCLVRSMSHRLNLHGPACSELFSGHEYLGPPVTDQAGPDDWPSVASLAMRYVQGPDGLPPSVVLP